VLDEAQQALVDQRRQLHAQLALGGSHHREGAAPLRRRPEGLGVALVGVDDLDGHASLGLLQREVALVRQQEG